MYFHILLKFYVFSYNSNSLCTLPTFMILSLCYLCEFNILIQCFNTSNFLYVLIHPSLQCLYFYALWLVENLRITSVKRSDSTTSILLYSRILGSFNPLPLLATCLPLSILSFTNSHGFFDIRNHKFLPSSELILTSRKNLPTSRNLRIVESSDHGFLRL